MLALYLPALLGFILIAGVFGNDETFDEDVDTDSTPEPGIEDPTNDGPDPLIPASPPPPAEADLPYNPVAPPVQPTSATLEGEPDRRGEYIVSQGTDDSDVLTAETDNANRIRGRGGDDLLFGRGGDDRISGQDGNDVLVTGQGNDFVDMGAGNDLAYLGDGDDGNGGYSGFNLGDDTTYGGSGADILRDRAGSDLMFGEGGDDRISALDVQYNPASTDTLVGGDGNDTLIGDGGDVLFGGAGRDLFTASDVQFPFAPPPPDEPSVSIADFTLGEDALLIEYRNEVDDGSRPTLRSEYDSARDGVAVGLDSAEKAFLYGVSAADIPELRDSTVFRSF